MPTGYNNRLTRFTQLFSFNIWTYVLNNMVNPFLIIIPGFPVFSLTITYFNAYTATSEVIITFKCFPYILTRVNSTNSFIIPPPILGRISIRQWQHISCGIIVQICVSCFEFGIGSHNKTIWRKESLNICIERRWERPQTILNFEYIWHPQRPCICRYTLLIYLSNRINPKLPVEMNINHQIHPQREISCLLHF